MHDENTYQVYGDGLRDYVRMLTEENERRDEKTRQRLVKLRKAEFACVWRPGVEQQDEHLKAWLDWCATQKQAAE